MEQIKSSTENREKILAAARKARRTSVLSNKINEVTYYVKENGLAVDEFKQQFHSLINKTDDHIIMNNGMYG